VIATSSPWEGRAVALVNPVLLVEELDGRVLDAVTKALDAETVRQAMQGAVDLVTAQHVEAASRREALTAELTKVEARARG
jgi:hypothetical protein